MKINKKIICGAISLLAMSLSLSACSFEDIFKNKLKTIDLSDANKGYAIGEVFNDEQALTIIGTYYNSDTKNFSFEEVTYSFTYEKNGQTFNYNPNTAFSYAGDYTLSVLYEGIRSNSLTIKVREEHIYATSIHITGKKTLNAWEEQEYTVTVSPSNCTAHIVYTASRDNMLKLTPTSTGVRAYGLAGGEVDIIATIASSKTTVIADQIRIAVSSSISAVEMSQTYNDVAKNSAYQISACPTKGDVKLLVIPVWFSDSSKYVSIAKKDNIRQDVAKAYFGSSSETGWESVSSFYNKESGGELSISGTVSDWYECGLTTATVGKYNSSSTSTLVINATKWYFDNHDDKRINYDYDGDGYLDGVIFIYAAPDSQASDALRNYDNLWAYCFWTQNKVSPSKTNPSVNVFFWASYDFMYGVETAYSRTGNSYHNGDTAHCTIDAHTYIHEMGHVLGLDDYYDYGGNHYTPAGSFSMQDCNVGGHDPYSVLALGWGKAYIPTRSMDITLRSFQDSDEMIILSPDWNSYNSPFDEYFILELYTPTGLNKMDTTYIYSNNYPQGPKSVGIRLWHVDARLISLNDDRVKFYNNANVGGVVVPMANTYYYSDSDLDYVTVLYETNKKYGDYNLLQLIRNDTTKNFYPKGDLTAKDLFGEGSTFDIATYRRQFVNGTKLNDGRSFNWSFSVNKISTNTSGETTATISLVLN